MKSKKTSRVVHKCSGGSLQNARAYFGVESVVREFRFRKVRNFHSRCSGGRSCHRGKNFRFFFGKIKFREEKINFDVSNVFSVSKIETLVNYFFKK